MVQSLALLLLLVLVAFPIWAIVKIVSLSGQNNALAEQLREIEEKIDALRRPDAAPPAQERPLATSTPAPATAVPPSAVAAQPPATAPQAPPPIPEPPPLLAAPIAPAGSISAPRTLSTVPPLGSNAETPASVDRPTPDGAFVRKIDWEQFTGAKLLAWIGGLLAFLGLAFFVKYSFEHGWVSPELRATFGFAFGLGLVGGGLTIPRERYATTAQTLIATGIVSLYAVTFACTSIYHFPAFEAHALLPFSLMLAITAAAFLLAVRLDARVVAVLGILGGFLTPNLLGSGHDNPAALFGYIALLDAGLIAVALRRRWNFLLPFGAAGTVTLEINWAAPSFAQAPTLIAIIDGFCLVFLASHLLARRLRRASGESRWSAAALPLVAFGFALVFAGRSEIASRIGLLFGLVLLADGCLLALAWFEQKPLLAGLAALGTGLVETAWIVQALTPANARPFMAVTLGFCVLLLAFHLAARRTRRAGMASRIGAAALPLLALAFGFVLLDHPTIAWRPGQLFSFLLLADLVLLALVWVDENLPRLHVVAGLAIFALLAAWTAERIEHALLPWALTFYLLFGVLHTAFPVLIERRRPAVSHAWWGQLFPPLALLLMFGPLLKLDTPSLALWPSVLFVDLLAIGLALLTASLTAVMIVLVLTLAATGLWMLRLPPTLDEITPLLVVIAGFAALFFGGGLFLSRRFAAQRDPAAPDCSAEAQLPAFSALLPFVLLVMMTERLPLANPSPVFGVASLLTVLVLALTRFLIAPAGGTSGRPTGIEWLPACALAGVTALEYAWHGRRFTVEHASTAVVWYLGFQAVFAIFPFLFRARFRDATGPWAVAALGGAAVFPLVYRLVQLAWPNNFPGLLPALFAVIPLVSLIALRRTPATNDRVRLNRLAWFGGVALLFITLIFPIQFERQWVTLGWALEGVALVWFYRRVPHPGLRGTGLVLLVAAFARLALNPAVLDYHARSGTALLNWYLYSYGIVTLCLFAAARLLVTTRERVPPSNPPLLNTLGTILAFLLLNLEIADFFSAPGTRVLTFQFTGNFARDMSYTIAWALFALALLLISLGRGLRAGRYAALALLGVALLKLFFHDLAQLEALYRIGVLFAVAIIAIVASVAYQRFLPGAGASDRGKS